LVCRDSKGQHNYSSLTNYSAYVNRVYAGFCPLKVDNKRICSIFP
jgi:hypothetical protein